MIYVLDIDECQNTTTHNCPQECVNTLGSYTCECYSGYRKDAGGICQGMLSYYFIKYRQNYLFIVYSYLI